MAEMIAMLDGLGAYGQNPVGDVDPRLLPSRTMSAGHRSMTGTVPTYDPRPYALGAASSEDAGEGSGREEVGLGVLPKVLIGAGALMLLAWGVQKSGKRPPPAMNGYPEPEMIQLPRQKRRRRRKAKKE